MDGGSIIMRIGYIWAKLMGKLTRSHQPIINYFRRKGVRIGDECLICSDISTPESFLISIGSDVTISSGVSLITHDYSSHLIIEGANNLYGRITIGNQCFIGGNSTIMYGVTLCDKIVVAAGSVVTKSFSEQEIIIGGNPAKKIGTWEDYRRKYTDKATPNTKTMPFADVYASLKNSDRYIVKR